MRTLATRLGVVVLLLALAVSVTGVLAQDDTMMEHGTVVCDEDLILSLYTAEYHFEYAAVIDQLVANGAEPGFTLNDFDYGQFAPWFDSMMSMMDSNMGMGMLSADRVQGLVDAMSMSMSTDMMGETMTEEPMTDSMTTMLTATEMMDEPAECSALRTSLREFYTALAGQTATSSEGM